MLVHDCYITITQLRCGSPVRHSCFPIAQVCIVALDCVSAIVWSCRGQILTKGRKKVIWHDLKILEKHERHITGVLHFHTLILRKTEGAFLAVHFFMEIRSSKLSATFYKLFRFLHCRSHCIALSTGHKEREWRNYCTELPLLVPTEVGLLKTSAKKARCWTTVGHCHPWLFEWEGVTVDRKAEEAKLSCWSKLAISLKLSSSPLCVCVFGKNCINCTQNFVPTSGACSIREVETC